MKSWKIVLFAEAKLLKTQFMAGIAIRIVNSDWFIVPNAVLCV